MTEEGMTEEEMTGEIDLPVAVHAFMLNSTAIIQID